MQYLQNIFTEKSLEGKGIEEYSRIPRILHRTSNSELSFSTRSVLIGELISPNRDYPYEGLSAVIDNENWKFLDGLAFAINANGKNLQLIPTTVRLYPWKSIYRYSIPQKQNSYLDVEYYLCRGPILKKLIVQFRLSDSLDRNEKLILEPLVDIRHMYSDSSPRDHFLENTDESIIIGREGKKLSILTKNPLSFQQNTRTQHWKYMLGDGSRIRENGSIRFLPNERFLYVPGTLSISFRKRKAELQISCGNYDGKKNKYELKNHNERTYLSKLKKIQKFVHSRIANSTDFNNPNSVVAIQGRAFNLLEGFDISINDIRGPDAGAYWFRNIWFRDAFQSICDNFDLYYRFKKAYIRNFLLKSLQCKRRGLIPNKLPERKTFEADYSALDSTLLAFICTQKFLQKNSDPKLKKSFNEAVEEFMLNLNNGPARLDNELLKSPPNYSWTDSFVDYGAFNSNVKISSRVPPEWIAKMVENSSNLEEFLGKIRNSRYFLVELNALWTRFLIDSQPLDSKEDGISLLSQGIAKKFKDTFFSKRPIAILDNHFNRSSELWSASVYSAALLPELFSDEEIQMLVSEFEHMFVKRENQLFGVLTREHGNKTFLGDNEYHGAVLWPRESLSLYRVLSRIDDPRAAEILLSNLGHQMEEGAIYFSNELFAVENNERPLPVKNPAQCWSQFVSPFLGL